VFQVSDNVCWKHLGHGIFIEDAVEQHNTYTHNLVAGTEFGTLLLSDMKTAFCTADSDLKQWSTNCG
jgi:hypothetical protein